MASALFRPFWARNRGSAFRPKQHGDLLSARGDLQPERFSPPRNTPTSGPHRKQISPYRASRFSLRAQRKPAKRNGARSRGPPPVGGGCPALLAAGGRCRRAILARLQRLRHPCLARRCAPTNPPPAAMLGHVTRVRIHVTPGSKRSGRTHMATALTPTPSSPLPLCRYLTTMSRNVVRYA